MHDFAILALLALATIKIVDFVSESLGLHNLRSLLTFIVGVGATVLIDYSVFAGWGVSIRDADVGVWASGFMVAGMTSGWRALFGYLTHDKAMRDETLGEPATTLRRAA